MIAEDEQNISDFLKYGLENSGYDVSVSEDGNKAWNMIQTCMDGNRPSAVPRNILTIKIFSFQMCQTNKMSEAEW